MWTNVYFSEYVEPPHLFNIFYESVHVYPNNICNMSGAKNLNRAFQNMIGEESVAGLPVSYI